MKHSHLFLLLAVSAVFAGCSTYQFTARQANVGQRDIDMKENRASLVVDYTKQVTATSDYQTTKKDAIAEAEFLCIQENKIDVVVDPIYKVEYNPFNFTKRYKAIITGYAGKYKEEQNRLDESKKYTLEDIEKYKLLYDPKFPEHYYNSSSEGDNYFFNSGALSPKSSNAPASATSAKKGFWPAGLVLGAAAPAAASASASVMLKDKKQKAPRAKKLMTEEDIQKALTLRNAGIGLMVGGALLGTVVALPMITVGNQEKTRTVTYQEYINSYYGYETRTRYETYINNKGLANAGMAFAIIGWTAAVYAGIPCLAVGQVRYDKGKKQHSMDITLNAGSNGLGLGLTF